MIIAEKRKTGKGIYISVKGGSETVAEEYMALKEVMENADRKGDGMEEARKAVALKLAEASPEEEPDKELAGQIEIPVSEAQKPKAKPKTTAKSQSTTPKSTAKKTTSGASTKSKGEEKK